jgi:Skp family chaperone for outer membrane proteins
MNKSFRFVLVVLALLVFGGISAQAQAQGRLATVDLVQVFDKYWKTKQAKLALADSKNDLKKELDGMNETHKKLIAQYQKLLADANDQAVSSEEREKRKKALEPRLKELQESESTLKQFVSRGDAELEQKTKRMMEDVIKDIRSAVAGRAKAGGYAFVLDGSAKSLSQTEMFLYNSSESDLTEAVIKELNLTAPVDFGTR